MRAAEAEGLANVLFASMSTPEDRLRRLGGLTRGFLYCFAVRGTTGLRDSLAGEVAPFIQRSRSCCGVPLALGLGISNPEQCAQAGELADGVVVGSALVKAAMDALDGGEDPAEKCGELAVRLKGALVGTVLNDS
jgi:tryptophan synthase alpha chain